jgi:hypothetical protein
MKTVSSLAVRAAKIVLGTVAVLAAGSPGQALEIGAGYNEQIGSIDNTVLARSGVKWVRAYVNVPRNFLTFGTIPNPTPNPPPNPTIFPISGVIAGNLEQEPSHVSTDADVLAISALDNLINAKNVKVDGKRMKVILSLKQDFTYPYPGDATAPAQQGRLPDPNTAEGMAELEHMITAIEAMLTTHNRGAAIDILVLGNEPMYDVQPNNDPTTAANYATYLNLLANRMAALRDDPPGSSPWTFRIFVGALDHPSDPTPADNLMAPAVLGVALQNPNVDGVDLHEHLSDATTLLTDLQADLSYVLSRIRPDQKLICTEFSIAPLLQANLNQPLGSWGPRNGYGKDSATLPVWQWINSVVEQAATAKPIEPWRFESFFTAQRWYPQNWFRRMVDVFALPQNRVEVVTYGLEQISRYPWTLDALPNGTPIPWLLNGVYNETLFGMGPDGLYRTNPLVDRDFEQAIRRHNR